jgi:hypothetical protein
VTINPGVTRAKSFVSGVAGGSRGELPKMPKLPNIAEIETRKTSAFPRLRGELTACFSTRLHRDAQDEKGGMSSYNRETRAKSQKPGARS